MNPSGEEGKMEPRGGLGVTRREGEVIDAVQRFKTLYKKPLGRPS